jgi:flagellar basal-body rod modification protein FlgD
MTRVSSAINSTPSDRSLSTTDAINDIDLGTFLELMIAELQNQDPLNPLDNKDMLAQISQIREVGATDRLTETLESVLLGQNIASATNLIGADITAISDDGESVEGRVKHVTIDNGVPKLQVDLPAAASPSGHEGNIEEGTYAYHVVWEDDRGNLFGIDLSGDKAVKTTGTEGLDRAVVIQNLPKTSGQKFIYRTDASGEGDYRLVGILNNGAQGSFVDGLADEERSETRLTRRFQRSTASVRSYQVSLDNVSGIRPPEPELPDDSGTPVTPVRPPFASVPRPDFSVIVPADDSSSTARPERAPFEPASRANIEEGSDQTS